MSQRSQTPLGIAIARRLRTMMQARNMTGADLMRKTGMGGGQISNYLNGYGNMRADRIVLLAQTLDCSADFLLGLSSKPARR